jgi:hypothetical protein
MTMPRIAQHLAARHPRPQDRHADRAETAAAGDGPVRPVDRHGAAQVGRAPTFDNSKAREVLGIEFTAPLAAIDRAADAVLAKG